MADGNDSKEREDLSEEPSQYRIEEYRRKGQVAQSREIPSLLVLLGTGLVLYVMTPRIVMDISEFMREVFRTDLSARADLSNISILGNYFNKSIKLIALLTLPACAVGFIMGALGSFSQIGAIFSTDPIQFDLSKINPISGAMRFFSLKHLYNSIRLVFKFLVIFLIAGLVIYNMIFKVVTALQVEPDALGFLLGDAWKTMFFSLCGALLLFAGFDYVLEKWEYGKSIRLTKEEQKQEHKEREGDPQIKARIRSIQREVARRRMMNAVKKADVIITNPTHIAVAVLYDKDKMYAPKVIAKGADYIALKIKQIALEAGVPLVENVALARTLFKSVKINQLVPRALYQAVAEVLAYVYKLKNRKL